MAPAPNLPKYRQLADELRRRIEVHMYLPGMMLPTEPELAAEFGFHRSTVREALKVLKQEGRVVSAKGRGTQVRPKVAPNDLSLADYTRALAVARGLIEPSPPPPDADPTTKREPSVEVPADADLAFLFGLDEGAPLWKREATVSVFGRPRWIIRSFYPMAVVAGTPLADPGHEWVAVRHAVMAELLLIGLEPTRVEEEERFRMPDADEIRRLRIVGVDSLVSITRQVYVGDRVVEVAHSIDYQGSQVRIKNGIDLR